MYNYVFFDLDGTLTKSEYGIMNSVVYALEKMGFDPGSPDKVRKFIGPPLVTSFKEFYGMTDEEADQATAYYRECYDAGEKFNAPLYDGIPEMLETLRAAGCKMYVVTSKPAYFAQQIVEHLDIMKYLEAVIGPTFDHKEYTKRELVAEGIRMATELGGTACQCIMIGDRKFDIDGAIGNSIDSIGVLYGYGSEEELRSEGATFIAGSPAELCKIVLGSKN